MSFSFRAKNKVETCVNKNNTIINSGSDITVTLLTDILHQLIKINENFRYTKREINSLKKRVKKLEENTV